MSWTQIQKAERAIILQVLRDDHEAIWRRAELEAEILGFSRRVFGDALGRLEVEGVVVIDGEQNERVRASRCALHLDELGHISI
jgi:hypothetical protein